MSKEQPENLNEVIRKYRFLILMIIVAGIGAALIISRDKFPGAEIIRDFGIALFAASTTGIAVEFYTQEKFKKILKDELLQGVSTQMSEMNLFLNLSFAEYHKSLASIVDNKPFRMLSKKMLVVLNKVLNKLAEGTIRVPIELSVAMQSEIMRHFHLRMDAVSFDDLHFWPHIDQPAKSYSHNSDADYGRKYYEGILSYKKIKKTVVTRIFLLTRERLSDSDLDLLSGVIDRHLKDGIGIAVAFEENFNGPMEKWLKDVKGPRKDFALLNTNEAATFFRKTDRDWYEALCRDTSEHNAKAIDAQRQLHKTLIEASILGSQSFQEQVRGAYTDEEWQDILSKISYLRSEKNRGVSGHSIFAVVLSLDSNKEKRIKEIKTAITESKRLGQVIAPPPETERS